MNYHTLIKFITVFAFSFIATACSNAPKKPDPVPKLGAALAASTVLAPSTAAKIVETPRGPSITLNDVLFDFEKAELRSEATPTIERAASYLQSNPERSALVEGHTDHTGDDEFNQSLSIQRSETIKNALVSMGIEADRIEARGFGESVPVADNNSLSGRQANRRVEIIFTPN